MSNLQQIFRHWNEEALELLRQGLQELNLPALTAQQEERFALYADFLLEYNRKINLTAITAPKEVARKHFVDSLTLQKVARMKPGLKLIDIGTGAGFPGVPLLILQPKLELTLLDSLAKRLTFLQQLLERLDLQATLLHSRAEDAARLPQHRARYDVATARAVAALPLLLEYALPFLKIGGCFIAQKGPAAAEELGQAEAALRTLGASCEREEAFSLAGEEERRLLLIRKERATARIYPRAPKQIRDCPL